MACNNPPQTIPLGTPIGFSGIDIPQQAPIAGPLNGGGQFLLIPGVYNVHLSAEGMTVTPPSNATVQMILVPGGPPRTSPPPPTWPITILTDGSGVIAGDKILQVTGPIGEVQYQFVAPTNQIRFDGLCFLSITPLLLN